MHIPVDPGAFVELWVDVWEEECGDDGGNEQEDGVVDEEGAKDMVDMEREGRQVGQVGEGVDEARVVKPGEPDRAGEYEDLHGCGVVVVVVLWKRKEGWAG